MASLYSSAGKILGSGGSLFFTGGSGSTGAPLLLYTDFVDGAASGGENNLGGYLSLFGTGFGTFANLGTTAGAKVFIGGAEVANYRVLDSPCTTAANAKFPVQRIICQIGSAGVQALTLGTAYQITVTVNGSSSPNNDIFGNPLTFTPISAPIFFIDESAGNNANAGTIGSPKQNLIINWNGSAMTGVFASNTSVTGGSSNGVQAGTLAVLRGGTYAHTDTADFCFCSLALVTGCSPALTPTGGSKAVNAGYLKVTAYPGPILTNTCEVPVIAGSSASHGGWKGNISSRSDLTNPYGDLGYAQYIAFSNLTININVAQTASDAAPCNIDNNGCFWRVVNNIMTYPTNIQALAGAVTGDGTDCFIVGNYINNVQCNGTDKTNHGIYADGGLTQSSVAIYAWNWTMAFNYIANITGGNFIQLFNGDAAGTDIHGHTGIGNMTIAYNYCDTGSKYGINLNNDTISCKCYGNVVLNNVDYSCIVSTTKASLAITIMNNTWYNGCTTAHGANAMIENDNTTSTGFVQFYDNVVVMGSGRSNSTLAFYGDNSTDTAWIFKNNQWFDPQGHTTAAPSGAQHAGEVYGDPLVTTDWTSFILQTGSPCIGTGTTSTNLTVNFDFSMNPMPRTGQTNPSRGAYA